MPERRVFRSLDEFKRYYYPKKYEREKVTGLSAQQMGEYLARRALEKLAQALNPAQEQDDG